MKNELKNTIKKNWQKPTIQDLDSKESATGGFPGVETPSVSIQRS